MEIAKGNWKEQSLFVLFTYLFHQLIHGESHEAYFHRVQNVLND